MFADTLGGACAEAYAFHACFRHGLCREVERGAHAFDEANGNFPGASVLEDLQEHAVDAGLEQRGEAVTIRLEGAIRAAGEFFLAVEPADVGPFPNPQKEALTKDFLDAKRGDALEFVEYNGVRFQWRNASAEGIPAILNLEQALGPYGDAAVYAAARITVPQWTPRGHLRRRG